MKKVLIRLAVCVFLITVVAPLKAQVTVEIDSMPLTEALKKLEEQSGYSFFYSNVLPDKDALVSVKVKDKDIADVMNILLRGLNIAYAVNSDNQIVLTAKDQTSTQTPVKSIPGARKISGVVLDTDGVPVIGAGVMVAGKNHGAVTDENGRWTLDLQNDNVTLEISAMGYSSQTLSVAGRTDFDVTLRTDMQFLEEVVVVGYGTQKKVNLTGSVSMVNSEDMAARPISSLSSGLQGMLPGVTVVNSSGQPGQSNTTIRVRGIGTIGNSNPLILIDGGMSKSYRKQTGIAGYTLTSNSYGLTLTSHCAFENIDYIVKNNEEMMSTKNVWKKQQDESLSVTPIQGKILKKE